MDSDASASNASEFSGTKVVLGLLWLGSVVFATVIGFSVGQSHQQPPAKNVLVAKTEQPTPTLTPVPTAALVATTTPASTPLIVNNNVCKKSGFAQKWEYLTSYTIKPNDSLSSIATSELHDSSRSNEIMQLNGPGPYVVDTTIYLPPSIVTKSSGNIKQVFGRLVEKNEVSWHVSFNGDINGQGILIPSFWFGEIKNKDTYKVGDCVQVLFDDGYKVFSVAMQ